MMARNLVQYANQLKNAEITKEKYDSLTTVLFPKDFNEYFEIDNPKIPVQSTDNPGQVS